MRRARRSALIAVFAALVAALLVLTLAIGSIAPRGPSLAGAGALPPGFVPPPVEPVTLMPIAPADARAANAAQAFVSGNFPIAAPFRFTGDTSANARAVDCLAAAVLYEAGDDGDGSARLRKW